MRCRGERAARGRENDVRVDRGWAWDREARSHEDSAGGGRRAAMMNSASSSSRELTRRVVEACRAMGFATAGCAGLRPSAWDNEGAWLGAGKHGTMDWLEASAVFGLMSAAYLKDVRSVIVVMDQHARAETRRGCTGETPVPQVPRREEEGSRGMRAGATITRRCRRGCAGWPMRCDGSTRARGFARLLT